MTFFTHILMPSLMHGRDRNNITSAATPPPCACIEDNNSRSKQQSRYDRLWALQYLMDKGVIDKSCSAPLYTTTLATCFARGDSASPKHTDAV